MEESLEREKESACGKPAQTDKPECEELARLKERFAARLDTGKLDLRSYSPLTFAYIGDAVYDLVIRTMVVAKGNTNNRTLHLRTTHYVKAESQAKMMFEILPLLTDEEEGIYKRGRNAKMATRAKNASLGDYKTATGFETLMGYLYLKNDYDRMLTLIAAGVKAVER